MGKEGARQTALLWLRLKSRVGTVATRKRQLVRSRTPRAYDANALTVKRLCDLFLESREAKIATGEITKRHWDELKKAAIDAADQLGRGSPIEQLRPDDFRKLRSKLGKGVGLKTLSGRMARTRSIFNFASKNGLLELNMNKLWGTERRRTNLWPETRQAIAND